MLIKSHPLKLLNPVLLLIVKLILSGFIHTAPGWAMEEEGHGGTHTTPILHLADETLLKIMDYEGMPLKALSLVSKHFHALSCDKMFARTLLIDAQNKLEDALRSDQCSALGSVPNMRVILPSGKLKGCVLGTLLRSHPSLRSLNLSGNHIDKEDAQALGEALKTNSSLIHLDLYDTSLTKGGALALFTALQTNTSIVSLNLSKTLNDDTGKEKVYAALSKVMTNNPNLRVLNLSDNWMHKDGLAKLCTALPSSHIEILDLSFNDLSQGSAPFLVNVLKESTSLKELNLSYNSFTKKEVKEIASALKENTLLEKLWIENQFFGLSGADAFVEAIQNHPTLKFLSLGFINPNNRSKKFLDNIVTMGAKKQIQVNIRSDFSVSSTKK